MMNTPQQDALEQIRKYYPHANSTVHFTDICFDLLWERLSLRPHQVVFADSICSDDVNMIEYPRRALELLGPFKMGGLNGFPFAGLTGMGAFAHHVPDEGAVMIVYGPHIGISKEGVVGKLLRKGQSQLSSCCGACQLALNNLQDDKIEIGNISDLDYQQNRIEQILLEKRQQILDAHNALIASTEVVYSAINKRIHHLARQTHFHCKHIILIGGIIINSDHDAGSFLEHRCLEVYTNTAPAKATFGSYELTQDWVEEIRSR